jgi:hypothetical protein
MDLSKESDRGLLTQKIQDSIDEHLARVNDGELFNHMTVSTYEGLQEFVRLTDGRMIEYGKEDYAMMERAEEFEATGIGPVPEIPYQSVQQSHVRENAPAGRGERTGIKV